MEKATTQQRLDYIKTRYTVYSYSTGINIPLMILLYWLNYTTGFLILLVLDVLSSIGFSIWLSKQEKELGI